MMTAYPLVLLSNSQKEQVQVQLEQALNEWKKDWFLTDKTGKLIDSEIVISVNEKFSRLNSNKEFVFEYENQENSLISEPKALSSLLEKLVPNYDSSKSVTDSELSLVSAALESYIEQLVSSKSQLVQQDNSKELMKDKPHRWCAHWKIDNASLYLELPGAWLSEQFSAKQAAKSKIQLQNALSVEKVKLVTKLKPMSLKASDALTLKKGEVIKLEHKIFEPLALMVDDQPAPISNCFLGKLDNKKSIQLS